MSLIVTGIGSRDIDQDAHQFLVRLGAKLAAAGCFLRSGGASGCDISFELGWQMANKMDKVHSYLPWKGFGKLPDDDAHPVPERDYPDTYDEAWEIAQNIHPAWDRMNIWGQKLHARNVYQVLGPTLDKRSDVLICIAKPDGKGGVMGGTATAWKLARDCHVPCFNLWYKEERAKLGAFLRERLNG